jgi:hypothetical protein
MSYSLPCSHAVRSSRRHSLACLLLALGLTGCHANPLADRTASLAGTWVGAMPPSENGTVLDNASLEGKGILWVLVEIPPPATPGNSVSGRITFCVDHTAKTTLSFRGARLGAGKVPLAEGNGMGLAFFDLNQGGNTVRAVLSGQAQTEAGYLKKMDRSAFDRRCPSS